MKLLLSLFCIGLLTTYAVARVCYNCDSHLHGNPCLTGNNIGNALTVTCPANENQCVRIQISNSTYVHVRRGCHNIQYRAECQQGSSDLAWNLQRQCHVCSSNRCNSGEMIGFNKIAMSFGVVVAILVNKFKFI